MAPELLYFLGIPAAALTVLIFFRLTAFLAWSVEKWIFFRGVRQFLNDKKMKGGRRCG